MAQILGSAEWSGHSSIARPRLHSEVAARVEGGKEEAGTTPEERSLAAATTEELLLHLHLVSGTC